MLADDVNCAASLRSSSYTSGKSSSAACVSPSSMADKMRVTSVIGGTSSLLPLKLCAASWLSSLIDIDLGLAELMPLVWAQRPAAGR